MGKKILRNMMAFAMVIILTFTPTVLASASYFEIYEATANEPFQMSMNEVFGIDVTWGDYVIQFSQPIAYGSIYANLYYEEYPPKTEIIYDSSNEDYDDDTFYFCASSNGYYQFNFVIDGCSYDGEEYHRSGTVTVHATGANTAPNVSNNTGMTVAKGCSDVNITSSMLEATDDEQGASDLTYALIATPTHGTLYRDGTALPAETGTFTQADINNGLLTYTNDGITSTSDGFEFVVYDNASGGTEHCIFKITVDGTPPTLSSAERDSDTQITLTLSEDCDNITNDGFTVTNAGGSTTYNVTSVTEGDDASHVVLTVDDIGTAAGSGVTVTYSALSGTVTDTVGNALETDDTGKTISAWDTVAPDVLSINREASASEITNSSSVIYRVTFSEGVTGVDKDDFSLTKTGTADGTVSSVSAVSATEYDVTVNNITGSGALRLDLNSDLTGIADIGGTAIATGYTSGEIYTIDNTAPIISSAVRDSDTQITLTLSEDCKDITNGGFTVTKVGGSTTYNVTSAVEGVDASHVVLTVDDIGTAAGSGVTVTYSTALGGTVTDIVGNALATDDIGKTIAAWDTTAPTVLSISRDALASEITNADSVTYRITFSEGVTGVDKDDFTLTKTGTADGTVSSVSAVSTTEYDVTVNNITGSGTLRLDLNSDLTGIADIGGTAIATGYTSGETYTIDNTAPIILSAVRDSDTQITLTLSEDCKDITNGGFTVTKVGGSTTYNVTSAVEGVDASHVVLTVDDMGTAAGSGVTVTYSTALGGTVTDIVGNALETDDTGKTISAWDTTAPEILSINREAFATETTNEDSVTYIVRFSEGVTGVDKDDFTLTKTGTADGTVSSVSAVSTTEYDVTVNNITGSGTLRLDLNSDLTGIADIGGTAIATGYTSGEIYTIDNTAPIISSAVRDSDTQITLTLSEDCKDITNGGFTVTKVGGSTTYNVTSVTEGDDASHVVLTVDDIGTAAGSGVTVTYSALSGTVTDTVGNALETDDTGKTISAWDTTAPDVLSINREASASEITNSSSVIYRVTFSEGVTGVDKDDFSLTKTGTADGTVSSVSAVSATEYDVTVNNITGSGTLRLDLNSDLTGIADIGGTEIATGYTSGETYTIDNTAPIISSAVRDSDTQITLTLSEDCENINSDGFTVTKTGGSTTYNVTSAVEGSDESHVVLTVADMGTAAGSGVTVTYSTAMGGTVTDKVGNALATDSIGKTISAWDTVAPIISSASLGTDNGYIDITFSKGVFGSSEAATALTADKLALTYTKNGADEAEVVISSIKAADSETEASASALIGGETTVRVFLGITGTPSGVETVAIAPALASSIYDKAGNAMQAEQTTQAMTLEDQSAPKVGESGAVTASDVTVSSVKLSWAAAIDSLTTQTDLQYKVVYSTSNNISTVADAESFGTLAKDWTVNISDATVTELTGSTTYYFNVLVKDAAGNSSIYNPISQATAFTVTYKNNYSDSDATVYYSQTAVNGSKILAPTQPARSGYVFDGWYTEQNSSNQTDTTAWNFKNETVENDTILYAKWDELSTYVAYDGNGADIGSVPIDSNVYALGATVKVKSNTGSLAKAGYTFGGWKSSLDETVYTPGQTFTISGGVTLSAVWTAVPATYTVTYNNNYSGSGAYTSQTAIASGSTLTAPSEPSRSGYLFIGWYKDTVCANRWNFSIDTVTANTNLYAKWAENTFTVSGKVEDDQGTLVSNATVKVMQGNVQFGDAVTTDSNGEFIVAGVPDGTYNLVVTKDSQKVTIFINVSGGNFICEGSIILPKDYKNSTLDVIGSETPNVVVDKLNEALDDVCSDLAENYFNDGNTVEIKLTVQQNDNSTNKATVEASMKSNGYTAGTVLDVDLTKILTTSNGASQESSISATNDTIKIIIPLPVELQGKDNYVVYRAHDYGSGLVVDVITTKEKNGEYIEISSDKTQITAYLKYFSTYAIAYKKNSSSTSDSSGYSLGSVHSYEIVSSADFGGSISPSGNVNVKEGTSKTYTIMADEGYCISDVFVDGESVGAVNSYTFSDVKAEHKIEAEFERRDTPTLPYYSENGKAVFIGFATDLSGEMKYIAPEGATVLFGKNPKSFTDISGHWAKNNIDFVTERELFFGTGDSEFSPQSGMTRAMFATVIGRLYERSYGKIANNAVHTFTDVNYKDYYGAYIEWASENNIITGVGGGQFKPDREITRQEMAAILYRFDKFLNASHTDLVGAQLNYSDAADISSWATEAAAYCQQTGIITGRSNGNFVPQGMATRAEVSSILQRFIENTVKYQYNYKFMLK